MKVLERNLAVFNENKLLILKLLYQCEDSLCGCDLVGSLGLPKNLVSYHMGILEDLGLIEAVRCGRKKNYRISPAKREKVQMILEVTELI